MEPGSFWKREDESGVALVVLVIRVRDTVLALREGHGRSKGDGKLKTNITLLTFLPRALVVASVLLWNTSATWTLGLACYINVK